MYKMYSVFLCAFVLSVLSISLPRPDIHRETKEQEDELQILPNEAINQSVDERKRRNEKLIRLQREFENDMCPNSNIWFVRGRDGKCECGRDLDGIVQCDPETKELSVLDCYCITSNGRNTVVGSCIFNCMNLTFNHGDKVYHGAPSDCQTLNREGMLCGKCHDGFALPAYSYNLTCMKCESGQQNWWLYLVHAFVPLSLFIIIILVFRINVVAPKLYVFVFAAQNISTPMILRILVAKTASLQGTTTLASFAVSFLATVYGIWNLDFLRVVLPDVCLNINPLNTLALDYLVAIYPMLLMAVSYTAKT